MAPIFKRDRDDEDFDDERDEAEAQEKSETAKLTELMDRADPLIDQVNALYKQFMAGVESRPPVERRRLLDQTMTTVLAMGKPTATYRFRAQALQSKYHSHCERWDKLMRDLENGKIQRLRNS